MEKVEIVIKIPKYYLTHPQDYTCLAECVRRGVLLPKGHGKLIDANELLKRHLDADYDCRITRAGIDSAPTIIEADNAESNENT